MLNPSDTGLAIRAARRDAGITVRGLAERMRLSPATISAVENGKTGVTVSRLHAFANALHVPATRLLTVMEDVCPAPSAAPAFPRSSWRCFPPLSIDPVLVGAVEAFVVAGYHGTSMRELAMRTGLSVPGIYHRYRDKQHLLVCILDITMDELHWRIAAARSEARSSVAEVGLIVEALALFHTHHRDLAFIGASEMRSLDPTNFERIAASRNRLQYALDDAIDRAISDGHLNSSDPRAAGRAIATMCTSLPQWFRSDGPSSPEGIARTYAQFALSLLGKPSPAESESQPT